MEIRPARGEDFGAIAAITNHYIATTAIHFGLDPIAPAELSTAWRDHPRYPWLVAASRRDGTVLGYAKAGEWRSREAYAWTAEVGLYVADVERGRGTGTALYTALLAELTARGFRSAVAGVTLPNAASVALHEKLGFAKVGVFADAGYKHGAWHAVGFWQKQLATGDAPPG